MVRRLHLAVVFESGRCGPRAGLGYAVMPRSIVPSELSILSDWPELSEVEIALLGQSRLSPATAALAGFIEALVKRRL